MLASQLKAFHAVASTGSFTRAAELLSVTQPAVSEHVRKLEQAYGASLFTRQHRGVTLTELGKQLFALSERSAEAEQAIRALLSQAKVLDVGQLTIGADAAQHVMPIIKRFRAKFPSITVKLVGGNSTDLVTRLQAFELDFAVIGKAVDDGGLDAMPISTDRLVAVAAHRTPLARKGSTTWKELAAHPLVLRQVGSHTRELLLATFQQLGLSWKAALEVETREACFEAVAQGLGTAIVSAGELPQDKRIVPVSITGHVPQMKEWLISLKARANLRLMKAFKSCVNQPK